ncbi:MAG TPA: thiamine pyrophosphate-dependent dehydrogenase E1 component subunit alpha [Burkholderiales bacterium]|nr:thiamine pyrophosphate-dependent dehydrogenase E1 component subunit alpha [Burkholderiales bacterium]
METLTHEAILKAGLYKSLSIADGEADTAKSLYGFMLRLRQCEEALAREYHPADEMRCPVHFCVGQEAVPAALSLLLHNDDYLYSHHRSHGYYLAKQAPMPALFAELYGKQTGANAGLAGSQDISFPSHHFFSGAILAGATAISLGSALAFQLRGTEQVAVAGFGESATDEGIFWETVNYAALAKLPLVLVCENNNYSVFSPQLKRQSLDNISERVRTFGVESAAIFGNDAMLVHRTLRDAIARARAGEGPTFVEAYTYRWSGHYGPASDDLVGYRAPEDLEAWKRNCPIKLLEEALRTKGLLTVAEADRLLQEIGTEIAECFRFAKSSPFPPTPNWIGLNYSSATPEADRLLVDIDLGDFDAHQESAQAKGY